ncbi:MAG: sigma-70 family RNA polymerase sigma factor [Pirellulales bacterium]|nr:sigma-70 family RNA polymerase sigma factor [Pirellulales bacterium]
MNSDDSSPLVQESRLVRRAQRGDRGALEELARRCRPKLVHLLHRRVGCWADAEDIAQQALCRAFERIDQHDGRRSFSGWLYRIALRAAADHRRKPRPEPGLDAGQLTDGRADGAEKAAHDAELRDNLWNTAHRVLSDDQYAALWLRYAEDLPIKEVARALRRLPIATRVLLHRARERLAPHVVAIAEADFMEADFARNVGSTAARSRPASVCEAGELP